MVRKKRVRVIHWRAEEAGWLLEACRAGGFAVEYDDWRYPEIARAVKANPPDAIVIDLSRLPSHGKETAVAFRNAKYSRQIPLVFVGGAAEKVEAIRALLPDAWYASPEDVIAALGKALASGAAPAVAPVPMMARYGNRTVAQKLGMKDGMPVGVCNPPRDYAAVVGELPQGAELLEEPLAVQPITLWFVNNQEEYLAALPKMQRIAARTKLWVVWRKSSKKETWLTDKLVREHAIEAGLVDYKICSLGAVWSGMLFAAKKA
jgi:hypothetical protein